MPDPTPSPTAASHVVVSDPQGLVRQGTTLQAAGRLDEALAMADAALRLQPDLAAAHGLRGSVQRARGRPADALRSLDEALRLAPAQARLHMVRGNALRDLGDLDGALASHDRALALRPDLVPALCNRSMVLAELGLWQAALASAEQAVAIAPDDAEARWHLAVRCLQQGDFARGWPAYEARWQQPGFGPSPVAGGTPTWLGGTPLTGKTLLLAAEQGLGDTLQFCRYAAMAVQRGARVLLEVQPSLAGLLGTFAGGAQILQRGAPRPLVDAVTPLMSLPLAFGTRLDTIPWSGPYLRATGEYRTAWAARLGPAVRPRIGIAWRGNPRNPGDRRRSMTAAQLLAALPPGYQYVSLQPQKGPGDAEALAAHGVLDSGALLSDFRDTAALCALVDHVVSVDTSVAHLAGALGRPLSLLLTRDADWRWLLGRDDSPWYPTARLYRQTTAGDWSDPLLRLRADLDRTHPLASFASHS